MQIYINKIKIEHTHTLYVKMALSGVFVSFSLLQGDTITKATQKIFSRRAS